MIDDPDYNDRDQYTDTGTWTKYDTIFWTIILILIILIFIIFR